MIPEDGDEIAHPNIFEVNTKQGLTLGQLKKAFPVPGSYHFRFLTSVSAGSSKPTSVWMDTTDENAPVPLNSSGQIFAKASRLVFSSLNNVVIKGLIRLDAILLLF